jgi:hypothetical protein
MLYVWSQRRAVRRPGRYEAISGQRTRWTSRCTRWARCRRVPAEPAIRAGRSSSTGMYDVIRVSGSQRYITGVFVDPANPTNAYAYRVARCGPSTRCGLAGLEVRVGRDARRCCERTARRPLGLDSADLARPMQLMRGRCRARPVGRRDNALMDKQVPSAGCIQRRARMVPGRTGGRHAKAPVTGGRDLRTTERAGAHSPQFGTYAQWTAGLLAALAVRPVPSCAASIPRGVNDKTPSDAYPGQVACKCRQPVMTLRAWTPVPGQANELYWNPRPARSAPRVRVACWR